MNEEDKKYNVRVKVIVAVMITFIITLCGTVVVYDKYLSHNGLIIKDYESSGDIANDINLLKTVIEKKYKGEIDDSKLEQAALKGYIEGLGDEYTEFLTQDEWDDLDSSLSDFVGIGVYMSQLKKFKRCCNYWSN